MKPGFASTLLTGVLVAVTACGSSVRRTAMLTTDPSEYPCVLHDPHTIAHELMVRQTITINAQHEGKPVEASFEAVLQKQGDTILIVGFGPMNVKAFIIKQVGNRIELEQYLGPQLPFSPRNVVVDVHRVFFKHLPLPAGEAASYSGVRHGELDGETVEETWHDGQLRAAVFTRPGSKLHGAIRVELGAGCVANRCEPESATLHNEWFGYTLSIANEVYEAL